MSILRLQNQMQRCSKTFIEYLIPLKLQKDAYMYHNAYKKLHKQRLREINQTLL